jgi:alkanesulfonate monooxygenase SsuD/methylene tetrahydromethanopterin reductase-like flavin-dependent oxidoreductase (luciferase family)
VAPLHHPARIAEEWAVIDNLTNGRAGLAIASRLAAGRFHPAPGEHPAGQQARDVARPRQVRRLWRGEAVAFPRKDGEMHAVVTQPRPVSKELPDLGHHRRQPRDLGRSGRNGCHVLTHLLGQSIDEVATRSRSTTPRCARRATTPKRLQGHADAAHLPGRKPGPAAREIAREPMKDYLRRRRAHQAIRLGLSGLQAARRRGQRLRPRPRTSLAPEELEASSISPSSAISTTAGCSAPSRMRLPASNRSRPSA